MVAALIGGILDEVRMAGAWARRRLAERVGDRWRDHLIGVETGFQPEEVRAGLAGAALPRPQTTIGDGAHYEPVPYAVIEAVLDDLRLGPEDVFVDVGCGRGRALCAAARRGPRKAVGVEASPRLADDARRNAARCRGRRAPIEVWVGDALSPAAPLDEGTVFFLFNPFGFRTLQRVIDRIGELPHAVRIAYYTPSHNWYLDDRPWLGPSRAVAPGTLLWESKPR